MQVIHNYPEYTRLIQRVCRYEDLLGQQRILQTLYHRDKSVLVNFQAVLKQINHTLLVKEELENRLQQEWDAVNASIETPNDWNIRKKEEQQVQAGSDADNLLYNIVQYWSEYIDKAHKLNERLAWCMQNSDKISHDTLHKTHKIQQEIEVQDIPQAYSQLLDSIQKDEQRTADEKRRIQEEIERKRQEEFERQAQVLTEQKMREEAAIRAKAELERKIQQEAQQKAKAELEEKLRLEAERREQAKIEQKLKEEAERQAREEAERLAAEEKKRSRSHSSIDVDLSFKQTQCPVCQTQYPAHYKVCLKDGTKLVPCQIN